MCGAEASRKEEPGWCKRWAYMPCPNVGVHGKFEIDDDGLVRAGDE